MLNQKEEKLLISDLLDSSNDSRLNTIAGIRDCYTCNASGINVDYILYLIKTESKDFEVESFSIKKIFENIFKKVEIFYSNDSLTDFTDIIDYVLSTEIIAASRALLKKSKNKEFNYCIVLSDRYTPVIYIDLEQRISNLKESYELLIKVNQEKRSKIIDKDRDKTLVNNENIEEIDKRFKNNLKQLKEEICKYIFIWIHAYRFLEARKELLTNKNIIAFSHRYEGWSKPIVKINENISIEFKTNFRPKSIYSSFSTYFYFHEKVLTPFITT